MFEPGILRDNYPLRQSLSATPKSKKHSLRYTAMDLTEVQEMFVHFSQQMKEDDSQAGLLSERRYISGSQRLDPTMIAREFARFSAALSTLHQQDVSPRHIESAYALLHRQVEVIPHRSDRVLTAGMAAAVLACAGMRVHLVLENELGMPYLKEWLIPVFGQLGYGALCVEAGADEAARSTAYQQAITVVSSRECAMDFLRDVVNWPQRGNPVLRKVDRLMGSNSRHHSNLMCGLPCAVFIDIDSALIDNARAPIALTRDAHPMHEVEELKQALEMVGHLQNGQHFVLTGEGAEVAFTELGRRQLDAWAEQLGGGWGVSHIAEMMLAVAIVVVHLLKVDIHYRIIRQSVEWLVDDRLVPGLAFYSKPFLGRMVELREECEVSSQREVAARASYQQIFNHYVHLCGMCHSSQLIEDELSSIYGLRCGHHWPENTARSFHQTHLLKNSEERIKWLQKWLASPDGQSARLVLVNDIEMLDQLNAGLIAVCPELILISQPQDHDLSKILKPDSIVLALTSVAEHLTSMMKVPVSCPLKIVSTQRSVRRSEDLRNVFWIQTPLFEDCERALVLADDDELFADHPFKGLQNMIRFFGVNRDETQLESRIRQIQATKGREFFKVRKGLLSHDATMHELLSFSGRGLYE